MVLAGGQSKRMGKDKTLLPFGSDETLTHYQVNRFLPYYPVFISTKSVEKFAPFSPFSAPFILDNPLYEEYSSMAALASVLGTLQSRYDYAFIISADAPFVSLDCIKILTETLTPLTDAVIPQTSLKYHPSIALYRTSLADKLHALVLANKLKLTTFLNSIHRHNVFFHDEMLFANLNTPEDYQQATLRIAE